MLGLYIHIPFCKSICSYCDFPKQLPHNEEQMATYIERVVDEIATYKEYLKDCKTIYIGGGTPNYLSLKQMEILLSILASYEIPFVEFTIEVNAELLTLPMIELFKKYKVNRISIGAQTFLPEHIHFLRRHHTYEIVKNSIQQLKKAGIENINIDMIYGFPGQTLVDLKEDVKMLLKLDPTHISYYNLILEEHTVLHNLYRAGAIQLLEDDLLADMSDYITSVLNEKQYQHYEISNYAKEGYRSKHNLLYWNCESYIGIGMRANGYLNSIRYQNQHTLREYLINDFIETKEFIDLFERKKEFFLLGLRKVQGVSLSKYQNEFNSNPFLDFNLKKWVQNGLLIQEKDKLRFTKQGLLLGNLVFEEFVG